MCLCCLLSICVNNTKCFFFWFASCGLVSFLVVLYSFLCRLFFIPFKRKDQNKRTQQNQNKTKMRKKRTKKHFRKKGQRNNSVSAVVFTNSVRNFGGGLQKCFYLLKTYKNRVSAYFEKEKRAKNVKKVESKICPRLSQNSVQSCCAT